MTVIGNRGVFEKEIKGPVPKSETGPFCYQLGMKKRKANEVMMK
jgi:hypothetical protein